jgi:catechol 2,3-dioxygenase-like lactoylglutathione lyase family enzyme
MAGVHFVLRLPMKSPALYVALVVSLVAGVSRPVAAQLAAPGPAGIVMGHVQIVTRDLDAQRRFWSALGGVAMKNGKLEMYQFPGVFIVLQQGEPSGGSVGSSINHIGFYVKSVAESLAKWQTAGVKSEPQTRPNQVFLTGPDDVRVEIYDNAAEQLPISFHHVHFFTADPLAIQAWYAKTFGAVPGKRAQFDTDDLPGVNLSFSKEDQPVAKTVGRSIDHIGFEVRDLKAFVKKLQAMGITLDRPLQQSPASSKVMTAYLTDPWGTQIELTENLSPAAR